MNPGKTILLVEDDPAIAMIIRETLVGECGHFASVGSLADRNAWLADHRPDLVITDVVLPDGDGIDSLSHTGIDPTTPVIVLSAQNTLDTAVRATGIGSYDYLPKPFDLDELEARVRALARRSRGAAGAAGGAGAQEDESFHGLRVDADSGAIYHLGLPLDLPPREAALLRALLARPGQAMAKERLTEIVFANDLDVQPDAVEVVAYRLRKRLPADGARLVTLRGLGYLLKAPD